MGDWERATIARLSTRVPGLDEVLGGGVPEYSFNLIAGGPGVGKTVLAHQLMFALASEERPALYFTILGEPLLKMLRYQQQFDFFDPAEIGGAVRFANLSEELVKSGLGKVLESIVREVEEVSPGVVVVDSLRTMLTPGQGTGQTTLQGFVQHLALHLTSWQATTFMAGEYHQSELRDNPVFSVADGVLWLFQAVDRSSVVRRLQVIKMRGQEHMLGLHNYRITDAGIRVFPLMPERTEGQRRPQPGTRISTGSPELDEMLDGGVYTADAVLVAGPAGAGKTTLSTQFIAAGIAVGEPSVMVSFEEHPQDCQLRVRTLGIDLTEMAHCDQFKMIYPDPLHLSMDEMLLEIREAVAQLQAKRVVIDLLSGFELAVAPAFRRDFNALLHRMVGSLTVLGITVWMTLESNDIYTSPGDAHPFGLWTDAVIVLRSFEHDGELRRVLLVPKMRGSRHSRELRECQITAEGLQVGKRLTGYRGILSSAPQCIAASRTEAGQGTRNKPRSQ